MTKENTTNAADALRSKHGEIAQHIASLKDDAANLRNRFAELRQRRDEIAKMPISKEEFIRIACEAVDQLADDVLRNIATQLRENIVGRNRRSIVEVGRNVAPEADKAALLLPLVTVYTPQQTIPLEFMIAILRDPMKAALRGEIAECMTWPFAETVTDLEAAAKSIEAIDTEMACLNAELASLVEVGKSYGETV